MLKEHDERDTNLFSNGGGGAVGLWEKNNIAHNMDRKTICSTLQLVLKII